MDISRITGSHTFNHIFKEIIPHAASDNQSNKCNLFTFQNKKGDNTDALQAIKLDPAVLEAQVTVDTTQDKTTNSHLGNTKSKECDPPSSAFDKIMTIQEAALLSLSPHQFELLMKFTETLRQQRRSLQRCLECAFCKNNGESMSWYSTHSLKDSKGRVRCPILRGYRCPLCGATGERAHTIKYCPDNTETDRYNY